MNELLLTDSFARRLRASTVPTPGPPPRLGSPSLTASALHAAAAAWDHTLTQAARGRTDVLRDLARLCSRAHAVDEEMARCLR